jgi:hypothetical protein
MPPRATQRARNLNWKLEEEWIKLSVLIHGRDKKFALQADQAFQSQGARVMPGRAISYQLDGPAGPFASAGGRWSTSPISSDSARLTVEGRFTPRNGWPKLLSGR